ncbi:hypothetical protein VMCG_07135 [Cytospora schulzeri]|uniref:2EXR domain-containing protein n=1 Tax=Cytospora schulzeri TaxID=448051 RepID=A0A423W4W6_9PEZI|nr:hypothetical protein VMCG_07135 [Valsa malicola]
MATLNFKNTKMAMDGSQTKGIFRLPPEIRNNIWNFSLPDDGKVVQARSDKCAKHKHEHETDKNCIISFSIVQQQSNTRPVPAVLHLCTESRAIVPFLHGGEKGASGIWWNPAVDKILFDFDFNPCCLEGRTGLCAVFNHVVVGISYGALFSIKLSLEPDMHTLHAETAARGQLAKLIEKLPEMQTLSIAYPDVSGCSGCDWRASQSNRQGLVCLYSYTVPFGSARIADRDRLRGNPENMVEVVSFRNPSAVFQSIELLDCWMRQMRVTDAMTDRQRRYIFSGSARQQQMVPPFDEVPFGPFAVKIFTEPAPHMIPFSKFYMQHSLSISVEHMRWMLFLLPEFGSPDMKAFLARVTGSPLPAPAPLDPFANQNGAYMSGHALLVRAAATNDRSILPKLVNVATLMYIRRVYICSLHILFQDQRIQRDALSQAILNQMLSLVRTQLDKEAAAAAISNDLN